MIIKENTFFAIIQGYGMLVNMLFTCLDTKALKRKSVEKDNASYFSISYTSKPSIKGLENS
ncbi:hypothetical protein [Bathymodiolus thermophilus thioautotrophic gill symbiont]|uniref:Uncharacterized protein n=2 Tax=Bathymodiolus thermophilus thioautotrophic gill symbiont TaxID=2360 RepID=A0A1J5U9A3_9GAMM|nr:hypothetical protein [Bathymodiolus thermophilus thioautotrophic gill symbiont]OIR24969.1 hypothetical protein BGC33_12285 [Bathymodiolus thermophilus thioautotrophic gill symbiont]